MGHCSEFILGKRERRNGKSVEISRVQKKVVGKSKTKERKGGQRISLPGKDNLQSSFIRTGQKEKKRSAEKKDLSRKEKKTKKKKKILLGRGTDQDIDPGNSKSGVNKKLLRSSPM